MRPFAAWVKPRPIRSIPSSNTFPTNCSEESPMNAVTREMRNLADAPSVTFVLDGREVTAPAGETLIEIADRLGIEIPRLCYKPGMEAVGNCRSCMVEIKG